MISKHTYRSVFIDRGGDFFAKCDLCNNNRSLQVHHIIQKSVVPPSSMARHLIDEKQVLSLLCKKCHGKAHNPKTRDRLLRLNARRYGKESVAGLLYDIDERMKTGLKMDIDKVLEISGDIL